MKLGRLTLRMRSSLSLREIRSISTSTYIKKIQKKKDIIGPLKKGKQVINDEVANTLLKQYSLVFSTPLEKFKIDDHNKFFNFKRDQCEQQLVHECNEDKNIFEDKNIIFSLENIFISEADIRRAMSKIDTSNACGPDGLPNILFNKCLDSLAKPITIL